MEHYAISLFQTAREKQLAYFVFSCEAVHKLMVKSVGKPDARNGHVRFDERGKGNHRLTEVPGPAPFLDSTPDVLQSLSLLTAGKNTLFALFQALHVLSWPMRHRFRIKTCLKSSPLFGWSSPGSYRFVQGSGHATGDENASQRGVSCVKAKA